MYAGPSRHAGGSSEEEDDMADVFGYRGERELLAARHTYRNRYAAMLKRTDPGGGWGKRHETKYSVLTN